jgi:hypothetical protein
MSSGGFGWPLTVTNPEGVTLALSGLSTDIGATIDPGTGEVVSGRHASVALPIALLQAASMGMPRGVADSSSKPWWVRFEDINGNPGTFKVKEAQPDRAVGLVVCILEAYKAA